MELMEPTTYILSPHSTELRNPEKWKDGSGIKDFLSATRDQSLEQLKNVSASPWIGDVWLIKKQAPFSSQGAICKVPQSSCFLCINYSRDTLGYPISPVGKVLFKGQSHMWRREPFVHEDRTTCGGMRRAAERVVWLDDGSGWKSQFGFTSWWPHKLLRIRGSVNPFNLMKSFSHSQKPGSSLASIPGFVVGAHPAYWNMALLSVGCG